MPVDRLNARDVRTLTLRVLRAALGSAFATVLVAATASGSGTAPSPPPRQPEATELPAQDQAQPPDSAKIKATRSEAEQLYSKGYDEAQEAKKLKKDGKAGDAKKKFGKALKKFEGAVERDPAYYQAWNMVGYCSRNLGDLKRAFAAYDKCLTLMPDYEEAHEYLGEAYLQSGDLAKAKVELAWLRARGSDEAKELAEHVDAATKGGDAEKKAEPEAQKKPQSGAAPKSEPDSTSKAAPEKAAIPSSSEGSR